jgi:hypothetical protein
MAGTGSVLLLTSSVFSPAITALPIPTFLPGFSWIRIAHWHEFVTSIASWYLLNYKPYAIFMVLHEIFISLILLFFLFDGRSNGSDFPFSGKIGNTIFTIFICIFTIFLLSYGRALITFYEVHYWREQ